jgi:hypothetical protein
VLSDADQDELAARVQDQLRRGFLASPVQRAMQEYYVARRALRVVGSSVSDAEPEQSLMRVELCIHFEVDPTSVLDADGYRLVVWRDGEGREYSVIGVQATARVDEAHSIVSLDLRE